MSQPDLEAFPPACAVDCRVLVLGSMPGVHSLQQQQYYAHPRNMFWPIVAELLEMDLNQTSYQQRLLSLNQFGVGLWDVLAGCQRNGSLDADILVNTIKLNDFTGFYQRHTNIKRVLLNGGKAWELYQRFVVKKSKHPESIDMLKMPSTSPAYAAMKPEEKKRIWLEALSGAL